MNVSFHLPNSFIYLFILHPTWWCSGVIFGSAPEITPWKDWGTQIGCVQEKMPFCCPIASPPPTNSLILSFLFIVFHFCSHSLLHFIGCLFYCFFDSINISSISYLKSLSDRSYNWLVLIEFLGLLSLCTKCCFPITTFCTLEVFFVCCIH